MKWAAPVLFALSAMSLAAPAMAQIYKCPDASGRTVIQQLPCAGGKVLEVKPASGHADAQAAADARDDLARMKWENDVAAAINTHKPLVGMTRAQADQALGAPTKVNASDVQGVLHDQVIYELADATWYVYTKDGVVTSVQHRPGPPVGAPQRTAQRCPTSKEIRDAEVSAGSIALSVDERVAHQRAIAQMRACGR